MTDIQISGFEMLSKLGQGGMATVWKARQVSLDRTVAIKILSSRLASDPGDIQRFQQEAQSAAKLKHPGIVQVYDANIENGLYFFVMEFVDGYTCADWQMRKGHLDEKDILLITDCVADALGYAWDREKMIHCDIKPDNIMVDDDGSVKVTDLGLSRTISTMASEESDEILGTPAYMAPEQAMGEPGLDCRTDMYSLGAMMYHLATGKLLFEACPEEEVMEKQVNDFVPNPRDLNPSLSRGFSRLIEVLMAKEQAGRPESWQDVREAITRIRKGMMPKLKLPEGMASTVKPSESRDDAILHIPASAGMAHGAGAPEKRSAAPFVIAAILVVCVAAAFVLIKSKGERPQPAAGTAAGVSDPSAGGTDAAQPGESQEDARARNLYYSASSWEKRFPDQIDGAVLRYSEVVTEEGGSKYAERAKRDIDRLLEAKRERAVAQVLSSLKREADRQVALNNYDAALKVYEGYSGELLKETGSERARSVVELRRQKAEWQERERVRLEAERQAKIDGMLSEIAAACIKGDFNAGAQRLERALGYESYPGLEEKLRDLFSILTRAAQIDSDIINSFAQQQGQHVVVDLISGQKKLLINGARDGTVLASSVINVHGRMASVASNFTLNDLSMTERIKRMGNDREPHVCLVKGVMAYSSRSFDHAKRYFESTHELIAPKLLALLQAGHASQRGEILINSLGQLIRGAGIDPGNEYDKAKWLEIIQSAELQAQQADSLRQRAMLYRQEYESDTGYAQVSDVVTAMLAVRVKSEEVFVPPPAVVPADLPNVVLPADIAALVGNTDAVMERLLADNRSMGSENVEMRKDKEGRVVGVRIRSDSIGNINALAALRDLRSFELRAGGRKDSAPLSDISALAGMPLDTVSIEGAAVTSLQPLKGLPIKTLRIIRTDVRDLEPLRGMMLESVDFSGTRVFDFAPLSLMSVKSFAANNTQLKHLQFMRNWQLESLELADTGVFDFSMISKMPLKRLNIANTQVRMLEVFKDCPIVELDISGSAARDLNSLKNNAATLRDLKMDRLPVRNFDVFRFLNLNTLSMENTEFNNLRLIAHMQLKELNINKTPVNALDGLDVSLLSNLYIEGTKITSIHQLQNAGELKRFYCRDTGIRNFTPISNSGITHLMVDDPDSKTSVLKQLPRLESVNWKTWTGR